MAILMAFSSIWLPFWIPDLQKTSKTKGFAMFFDMHTNIAKSSKMMKHRSQKLPRWRQDLHLGYIWRLLGRPLGPSCRLSGHLGASWGSSWCLFGLLLAIFGAISAPNCLPGATGSLPDPSEPRFSSILGAFFIHFRSILIDITTKFEALVNESMKHAGSEPSGSAASLRTSISINIYTYLCIFSYISYHIITFF